MVNFILNPKLQSFPYKSLVVNYSSWTGFYEGENAGIVCPVGRANSQALHGNWWESAGCPVGLVGFKRIECGQGRLQNFHLLGWLNSHLEP